MTYLHLFFVSSQPANVLLLLDVPLLHNCPLILIQCNVFPWNRITGIIKERNKIK